MALEALQNTVIWLVAWPNDSLWVDLFVANREIYWNLFELSPQVKSHSNVLIGCDFVAFLVHFGAKMVSLLTTHGVPAKPGDIMLAKPRNDCVGVPLGEPGEESGWDPCVSAPPPS